MSVFFLSACNQPATLKPEITDAEIRAEQEEQRRMIEEAAESGGAPRPWRNRKGMYKEFERVAEKIEAAGAQMCKEMGLPKLKRRCYFYFDTSRNLEINASADGTHIVFTRGMLRFLKDEDELAIVMGHELAHNLMGHRQAKTENAQTGQILGMVLDSIIVAQGGVAGGNWERDGAIMGAYGFSQSFESEADYVGLYVAARAGYNIRKAPDVWRRMSLEDPDGVYNSFTHPNNAERAVTLRKTVAEIRQKKKERAALVPNMDGSVVEGHYEAERKIW